MQLLLCRIVCCCLSPQPVADHIPQRKVVHVCWAALQEELSGPSAASIEGLRAMHQRYVDQIRSRSAGCWSWSWSIVDVTSVLFVLSWSYSMCSSSASRHMHACSLPLIAHPCLSFFVQGVSDAQCQAHPHDAHRHLCRRRGFLRPGWGRVGWGVWCVVGCGGKAVSV